MSLDLKKFDMRSISFRPEESKAPVIVMIGKRGLGKSVLIADALYNTQDIPIGTVISGTEAGNGYYGKIVPKLFIHHEYDTLLIQKILQRQKMMINEINKEVETYKRSTIDARTFVVMDDCLFDDKWTRDKFMRCLFMNGRHWKIMLIISIQYPIGIPPMLRTNIDYVFILRENIYSNRKRLYENYASMFPTFESFCSILDQTTENYECLVINNTVKSNKISDQIFWYKAPIRPDFKLGAKKYWELSEKLVDDENENDEIGLGSKGKKGGNIVVKKKW
jgi:hypothetical protein